MTDNICTTILDNQLTAILVLDEKFTLKYTNPAAVQLLGISSKRAKDVPIEQLFKHTQLDQQLLDRILSEGASFTDSSVTLTIDNQRHAVEFSVSPISFLREVFALVELKLVDKQRLITQELNQKAQQQAAKELIRGLAHEIKNPLGGLRGAAQLLEKMLPDKELTEYTQIIIEQADRLRNLVDRLLGPQKVGKKEMGNIHLVLEKVRQLVELENPINLDVVRDYDPSLPDFMMDGEQLQQAILNIVGNAALVLKSNQHGKIVLKTRTEHQVIVQDKLFKLAARIEITDNGPGIPEGIKDTLFYPLVTGRKGGTGLGLSIAQKLIDQHQGKIEVNSWPGETTFTIYLPLTQEL